MPLWNRLASLGRNLFSRRRVEGDLDDELHAYLNHLTDEKRAAGLDEREARRTAHLELGGLEQIKEEVRDARSGWVLQQLMQDFRYAARTLRRHPAFPCVAVLALALGIGANTAMFSVAYGILYRPLPYPDADRVAVVFMRYAPRDFAYGTMCVRDYLTWKQNNHTFEEPSLFRSIRMDLGGSESVPEQVQGASVTAGFFPTLQVPPAIGRTFMAGEDQPMAGLFAILSDSIWRRRYSARADVLGRTILVNGTPATVIGVMPPAFALPRRDTEVWTNLRLAPPTRYGPWFYRGLARLKPGVTLQQAQAELNAIGLIMMQQNSYYKRLMLPVQTLRDAVVGTAIRPAILVLAGAVGLVLLIAIVNVANLMLARATVREREMALRLSLGAGRGRLVRQLLTESVLLSFTGGAAGLGVAWAGVSFIRAWNPGNLPFVEAVRLDGTALGFMLVLSMLTGILFGLAPALQSARTDLNSTIKEGGRGAASGHNRGRTRAALVAGEIALSLMLLVGAGLLLRSFANLQRVAAGFTTPPRQLLSLLISPGNQKYSDPHAGLPFYDEVLRRARSVPGVEAAALTDSLPPDRQGDADTFGIEGQALSPGEQNPVISDLTVGPGFFRTLGIPLLHGRDFTEHDTTDSTPVAIVSEGFARRFFPHQDPLGKRIRRSEASLNNPWMQIVGIVGNLKLLGLAADTEAAYYMPASQSYGPRQYLAVRTSGDAARVSEALRRTIQAVDPGVTLAQFATMEESLSLSVSQPRFNTLLLVIFAAIALLLAAVGIYGLIAYSVAQRTHEIGVRMALGAARRDVLGMVLRQGIWLALGGIAAGLAGAFALTRLLRALLFGVGVTDTVTFAAAPTALMLIALLATLVPALRATRTSPVVALRGE